MYTNKPLNRYRQKLRLKENKKRVYFVLKFLFFLILGYTHLHYMSEVKSYGIKPIYLRALLLYISANLIISTLRLLLVYIYIKRHKLQNDYKDNFILGINQIASILSFSTIVVVVLYLLKINPGQLFTSLSIVAASLVLLFKDYISNVMNGLIIMFSDQFSLNEYVKIGNYRGRIVDINLLHIQLKSDEEDVIHIPNNLVLSKDVVNYTNGNVQTMYVEFELKPILYDKLLELESELIQQLNKHFSDYVQNSGIHLRIIKITKDEVVVRITIGLVNQGNQFEKLIRNYCNQFVVSFLSKNILI